MYVSPDNELESSRSVVVGYQIFSGATTSFFATGSVKNMKFALSKVHVSLLRCPSVTAMATATLYSKVNLGRGWISASSSLNSKSKLSPGNFGWTNGQGLQKLGKEGEKLLVAGRRRGLIRKQYEIRSGLKKQDEERGNLLVAGCRRCFLMELQSLKEETQALSVAFSVITRNVSTRSRSRAEAIARHNVAQSSALEGQEEPEPEQYENELVARDHVLRYLQSEGLDVSELEDVGLPPSVAVMKERVTFLRKIGLTTKDINGYPLMVGCSVKKNLVPVLSYLEKLNVEARCLPDFIRKYPMVLSSSVVMDLEPVVDFLLGIGIQKDALGRVLTRYPDILGFKIEGTMSTSVAYLVSLGVNMREIGAMVTEYPEILGMRVGNNIKPKVDYLLSLGIPKQVMAKILEVKPFILGFDLDNKIQPCVRDLVELGVKEENVSRVIIQYADVLGLDVKHRLDSKMGWLSKQAGVKREDIGQIIERLPQILAININLAQSRVDFLKESGFSVEEIGSMVAKCPQILAISIEEALRPNFDFFLVDMKRPLSELVEYPTYFTYSLQKRIRPRYTEIEQRNIKCSLEWFLNCSDAKFNERLQVDFVERPDENETEDEFIFGGRMKIKGEDLREALDSDDESVESP